MLTLRKEHMDAFKKSMERNYESRTVARLRAQFGDKLSGTGDEDLKEMIRFGLARSAEYGVSGTSDVDRYVEYMVEYGRDFDTSPRFPWAHRILTAEGLTGTAKMDQLDNYTTFELRR